MSEKEEPTLVVSNNALASVAAALSQDPRVRTEAEQEYDKAFENSVLKPEGHTEKPLSPDFKGKRAYTLTTIASSVRYGGTRTVMILETFDEAVEAISGDRGEFWWEYSYGFAVIESFAMGYAYGGFHRDQYWFRYDKGERHEDGRFHDGKYVAIETPPEFEHVGQFAVG
jgi:hypothetical protein